MGSLPVDVCKKDATPNIWLKPVAFPSHVRCFFQFAKLLASHKLIVTVFCTKGNDETLGLHATLESWRSTEAIDIRLSYVEIEEPDFADGPDDPEQWAWVCRQQEERMDSILKHVSGVGQPTRTCVISDIWIPGVHESALKYNIPAWFFSAFSVGYIGATVYLSQLQAKGILKIPFSPLDTDSQEEYISIPGLPLLRLCELDHCSQFSSHPFHPLGKRNGQSLKKSEVIIFSTFEELESRAFRECKILVRNTAVEKKGETKKIYTVGPLFPLKSEGARSTADDPERHPCMKFLDGQADSSVLFVAFGSVWELPPEQMQEIAFGLEGSEKSFLCAFHAAAKTPQYPTGNIFDVISSDCISRTKERGLFVQGWVPQLQILGHPAIGGFLSHCGHNSFLESLGMGVPLLTWPLLCDQPMNARFVVDEIHAGLEIEKDPRGEKLVDRKEVEKKVRDLLQSEEGKAARKNAHQIRELALQSVAEDGSSYNNIRSLVTRIRGLAEWK
ncbi:hypothetical protein R1flu_017109 [Riccia fluitans]|uniref:Glycosyltransferase n=1 Tax=Riccia fluitans TaxID=41844 RepID=A0ABD1YPB7_9MARC